ncbi:MAG: hypothetical protein ACKOET_02500 [Verrucomicrobiota bacterium]
MRSALLLRRLPRSALLPALLLVLLPALRPIVAQPTTGPAAAAPAQPSSGTNGSPPSVLILVGAPGDAALSTNFTRQARRWEEAAQRAGAETRLLGLGPTNAVPDRDQLREALAGAAAGTAPLWLVLLGHGTFDGREARFNLRGPDVTATDLGGWLQPLRRPVLCLNTASASAPFLKAVAGTNRVVITATRSGSEQNLTRLGSYLAEAIGQPEADLDQDGQTSALEAFLHASAQVAEFYKSDGRLATEHPLLDDNGDGLGTPADWFRGIRATRKPANAAALDGLQAHQFHLIAAPAERSLSPAALARRDALERDLAALRERKATLPEDEYYRQVEQRLLELARVLGVTTAPPAP